MKRNNIQRIALLVIVIFSITLIAVLNQSASSSKTTTNLAAPTLNPDCGHPCPLCDSDDGNCADINTDWHGAIGVYTYADECINPIDYAKSMRCCSDKDCPINSYCDTDNGGICSSQIYLSPNTNTKDRDVPSDGIIITDLKLNWPTPGFHSLSSCYGWRKLNNKLDFHGGIDISIPENRMVQPAAKGVVVAYGDGCVEGNKRCNGGLGNFVTMKHNFNGKIYYTHYSHLKSVSDEAKDSYNKGNVLETYNTIGVSGNTGYSTGAHLHFELGTTLKKLDSSSINPCPYLYDNGQKVDCTCIGCSGAINNVCNSCPSGDYMNYNVCPKPA